MNYTEAKSLDTISEAELTQLKAAEYFCKNTYNHLYIIRDYRVVSILKKEDVNRLGNEIPELDPGRYFVSDDMVSDARARKEFSKRPFINRLAVIDENQRLIGEFNDGALPERARNIQKNIMALRYVPLFENELKSLFCKNNWGSVLVLSDETIFDEFRKAFPWLKAERSDRYIKSDHSVIFNFLYHNKLMHYFCIDSRIKEFSKIVEKAAFIKMKNYLENSGIAHLLLRAPVYERLECLSPCEKENLNNRYSQSELIFSDEYMNEFADSSELIRNIRSGAHLASHIEDNGWIFVQTSACNDMINVSDGRRKSIPETDCFQNSMHIFGTCLVYGFMTADSDTIPSLLQKKDNFKATRVVNHGALLGRNLLNMIVDILSTEFRRGDIAVLIDIFEDYPEDSEYGIIDTNVFFNDNKPKSETWFLDFPLHCNRKANQLIANLIEQQLSLACFDDADKNTHCYIRECKSLNRKVYYILHQPPSPSEIRRIAEITSSAGAESVFFNSNDAGIFPKQGCLPDECCAVVHYGLGYDYHLYPQYHFFIENADMLEPGFMKNIIDSFRIKDKKILLYLGKFPEESYDVDGGAQLANQLISSLSCICHLDIAFIRKEKETYSDPFVCNISYEEYVDPYGNKFNRRMKNLGTNKSAIMNGKEYDLIIAGHCSKFFGIESEPELMKKAVIFPMMLTSGYKRCGEKVPAEYTERENMVLSNVSEIITPSTEELNDIISDYDVNPNKVKVIPRGISPLFRPLHREKCSEYAELVSIGSFKSQKNHISEVKCLKMLLDSGMTNIHLTLIGAIHDRETYDELCRYINDNALSDYVTLHHNISQKKVAEILKNMDICISCSLWETFGRGIFECMTSGLPCVLSNKLKVIKGYADNENNIIFCSDLYEMADSIRHLILCPEAYNAASETSLNVSSKVSYYMEREQLVTELVYNRFGNKTEYMSWDERSYEKIWQGGYSECLKNGDRIRKYYKYPNIPKIKAEFSAQKCAYENGINTAEPLFISSDRKDGRFFMESRFIKHRSGNEYPLSLELLDKCLSEAMLLQKLATDNLRPFSFFGEEFSEAAEYYSTALKDDIAEEIEWLFSFENNVFVHGDLLLKNIGICSDEVFLFDFQNACCGPAGWDQAYILSEFSPEVSAKYIDEKTSRFVLLILKIRIGRAIKWKRDFSDILQRLEEWERFIGAEK